MKRQFLILITIMTAFPVLSQIPSTIISFGVLTDVHYAEIPESDNKAYSRSLFRLQDCIDKMNQQKVDFIIELGDFKDMSTPPSEEKALVYLFRAEKIFSSFRGDRYHVLGNHDEDCISKRQFLSVAKSSGIEDGNTYYSFDHNGMHFIVLDACFDSAGRDYSKGRYLWEDSNIPDAELKWLKKDLKKASGRAVVFIHQVLDSEGAYAVNNAAKVRSLLERSGKVAAVFQGHYHEGQYRMLNGIHYYTLKAMVDGIRDQDNSYAIVTISDGQISIKGYGNAESMSFGFGR